jgi:hypothetical protein
MRCQRIITKRSPRDADRLITGLSSAAGSASPLHAIGDDGCFECVIVFDVFQSDNDGFGSQSVPDRISPRRPFAVSALSIDLDLPSRVIRSRARRCFWKRRPQFARSIDTAPVDLGFVFSCSLHGSVVVPVVRRRAQCGASHAAVRSWADT